jgi:pilus assembly protein CpaC
MLKVEVAEVNRKALRELGFDFIALGTTFTLALFGGTTAGVLSTTIDEMGKQLFGEKTSAIIGDPRSNTNAFLRALEQKGLVKALARPNLIAASGASASFLVGGEFPIPVPGGGGTGTVTIQFKPFGVRLDFTPTVNDLGSINLKITPEVSDLDFENGLTTGGFRIPALRTRRASTIVDLRPGQSLAIGGLISSDDRKVMSKFPILGDIPVLGALFRSTAFIRNETDLIIFVTPEIVKPLEAAKVPNLEEQMKTTPAEEKEMRQIPPGR